MHRLALAMALLVVGSAETGAYVVIGSGANSCETWTAHRRAYEAPGPVTQGSQAELSDTGWVVGFLSGIGATLDPRDGPLDGVDAEGVWAWVDKYCQANPIDDIADAATAFYFAHPHN